MQAPGTPPGHDAASLLWRALTAGTDELEQTLARAARIVAAIGLALSLWVGLFVSPGIGRSMGAIAAWCLLWFTVARGALAAGVGRGALRWLNPLVETLLPALVLVALARTAGPAYALGSWVPPQLWALFLAGTILRLRPELPAAMGAVAAAAYGGAWMAVVRPALGPDPALLHTGDMQLVRMGTLLLMGFAGSAAVVWLRTAVGRAGSRVRSRELFGKYRLGREIASGGMGTVIEALYCPEGGFERRVAIKRIHPHLAGDAAFLARFRSEAELCARLNHPNIVAALDFGREEDTWFLAMEYVDGPTLHEVLKLRRETGEALDPALVAHVAREIAEALHHAHAVARDDRGRRLRVVHRDLSPSNVLLDRSGRVRITDFGIARALRGQHDVVTPTMTGKPAYMAPEQLRQEPYDERADLFSLGVVLFEMLCNTRLFGRDEPHAAMLAVLEASIPLPSEVRADLAPGWDPLLTRLLARDPTQRFTSAAELSAALAALQEQVGLAGAEDVATLVRSTEDLPVLDLDSTTDVLAHTVGAEAMAGE